MGTNYYLEEQPPCPHCGREYPRRHIGKSNMGWCFALHVYPSEGINTLDDWRALWVDKCIVDEYGREHSPSEMERIITERKGPGSDKPPDYTSWAEFQRLNYSQPGPNGLIRHRVWGGHCVGHGEGTWDYIIGDFS